MKNECFKIKTEISGLHTEMFLEGKLTIQNSFSIQKEFLSALATSKNVTLRLQNITRVDIAFLQLLLAMEKSAAAAGKTISVTTEPPGFMQAIIDKSGLPINFSNHSN